MNSTEFRGKMFRGGTELSSAGTERNSVPVFRADISFRTPLPTGTPPEEHTFFFKMSKLKVILLHAEHENFDSTN